MSAEPVPRSVVRGFDGSVICGPLVAWWVHALIARALREDARTNGTRYPDVIWEWVDGLKYAAEMYEEARREALAPTEGVAWNVARATGSDATSCIVDAVNEVSVSEYAAAVGAKVPTIRKRIARGRLPARSTPRGYMIRRENLVAELEAQR